MKHPQSLIADVVRLHFVDGLSYGKIADRLNMGRSAVAGIISRNRPKAAAYKGDPAVRARLFDL